MHTTMQPGIKRDMIRKVGKRYFVKSHKTGKRLSRGYHSKKAARKRLKQIQYFKHRRGR